MNKCCFDPTNHAAYGNRKKEVQAFKGLLVIRYITYLRCKKCGTKLKGEVVKNIHDSTKQAA